MRRRPLYSLLSFFRDLFIILPRRVTIDLSRNITFFSKLQAIETFVGIEKDLIQSACGVLSIQMVMSFYSRTVPSLADLSSNLMRWKAFSIERGLVLTRVNEALLEYGFRSEMHRQVSCKRLFHYLTDGIPVIASVVGSQGGHLVVLVGVSIDAGKIKKVLYLDPNNSVTNSLVTVSLEEWQSIFNKRALVVLPTH
ncbi:MAG: papain-like cysteine protease family protein [Hyphomicrobium sp.]|uniref:C39 family peptidase n=1 Tax=Hyphomicrobium sp. TaxID=82 RepID=UPI003564AFFB